MPIGNPTTRGGEPVGEGFRWPARPGEPQHEWEPARAVTAYSPIRNERLRAIGNGIVPQLVADFVAPHVVALIAAGLA